MQLFLCLYLWKRAQVCASCGELVSLSCFSAVQNSSSQTPEENEDDDFDMQSYCSESDKSCSEVCVLHVNMLTHCTAICVHVCEFLFSPWHFHLHLFIKNLAKPSVCGLLVTEGSTSWPHKKKRPEYELQMASSPFL